MNFLWSLVALFAVLAVCQNSTEQDEITRALALLQTMPLCARTCLLDGFAAMGSTKLDISASCNNQTATVGIEACVVRACTIREQLTAKNVTETLCNRPVRESSPISVSSLVGLAIVALAYFMRMASKVYLPCERGARVDTDFWWDDFTISVAFALLVPITALANKLTSLGIGKDVWTIKPDTITTILKWYYADEILYLIGLPTIKIAILCTYLRIFQTPRFRLLVYGAIGLNVAYAVTFIFATVFQCVPVQNAWLAWDGTHPHGHCNNINAQSWASAALNIVLDIIVVVLPMPMLWKMTLNKRKKILVMMMFGVGFFVTFVSIFRLQMLVKFGDSQNVTHDYKKVGYWTVIEIDTALLCACMPGIRNLLRRAFPRAMGQSVITSRSVPTPGLSGRTAIGSGNDKDDAEVFVRPRRSDDGHFIPLENINSNGYTANERSDKNRDVSPPPIRINMQQQLRQQRNFSRPASPPAHRHSWYPPRSVSPA